MRHAVSIGDEIVIMDQLFIVTEVKSEMNKPSVLTTKQPVELIDFDRSPLTGISIWGDKESSTCTCAHHRAHLPHLPDCPVVKKVEESSDQTPPVLAISFWPRPY